MSTNVQSHIGTLSGGGFRTGSMSPCSRERAALRKEWLSPGWGQERSNRKAQSLPSFYLCRKSHLGGDGRRMRCYSCGRDQYGQKQEVGLASGREGLLESICVCACVCVCVHALRFIVAGTFECRMEYICVWVLVHIGGDCQFLCCCIWPRTS